MMRDLAQRHVLTVNIPFLMYRSGSLAHLGPIGGRGFRAAPEVLKRVEGRSLTGCENSLEELLAVYGLDGEVAVPAGKAAERTRVRMDADEEGRPVEVLAP